MLTLVLKDGGRWLGEALPESLENLVVSFIVSFILGDKYLKPVEKCIRISVIVILNFGPIPSFHNKMFPLHSSATIICFRDRGPHFLGLVKNIKPLYIDILVVLKPRISDFRPHTPVIHHSSKAVNTLLAVQAWLESSDRFSCLLLLVYVVQTSRWNLHCESQCSDVRSPVSVGYCYSICHVTQPPSRPPTIGLKPMGLGRNRQRSLCGSESASRFCESILQHKQVIWTHPRSGELSPVSWDLAPLVGLHRPSIWTACRYISQGSVTLLEYLPLSIPSFQLSTRNHLAWNDSNFRIDYLLPLIVDLT